MMHVLEYIHGVAYSHSMKPTTNRYTAEMVQAISNQSLLSIALNATVRGILFTAVFQLISYVSVGQLSSPLQLLVLTVVFAFIVFSIDTIERSWAQFSLRSKN